MTTHLRITNLVSICRHIQSELWLFSGTPVLSASQRNQQLHTVRSQVEESLSTLNSIFSHNDSSAAALPDPSRRAYQWLAYLIEKEALETHFSALQFARERVSDPAMRRGLPRKLRDIKVEVQFYHMPALFRTRPSPDRLLIVAHEGFTLASQEVITALIAAALHSRSKKHLAEVCTYGASDDFLEFSLALELIGVNGEDQEADPRLEDSFRRVNEAYFANKLPKPRLVWSKTLTHRKFGHYQPATDTVMISLSLRDPRLPEFVLDFLMYHELLHKRLGVEVVNGRHYGHTRAFRDLEKKYPRYNEAEAFLKNGIR